MRKGKLLCWLQLVTAAVLLAGCATPLRQGGEPLAAWVQAMPEARMQARIVMAAGDACPGLVVDGRTLASSLRARGAPSSAQPVFDMTVCEAMLPTGAAHVQLGVRQLPVPNASPRRIVVLGDTGCRTGAGQRCDDPLDWPFARIAAAAAAMRPDLVIHVGDYHYREQPCPAGAAGCPGTPMGYGWDVWRADFFAPAAPLLAAAPWVFVRGNHEECTRAGQGWHRLLVPQRYDDAANCDDRQPRGAGDFTAPYAVPLGPALQLVVFDSGTAGDMGLHAQQPGDARALDVYLAQARSASELAARAPTWFVSHHPVFGYAPNPGKPPHAGNASLQEVLRAVNGDAYYPPSVQLGLHGHVHLFEALTFTSGHPPAIVAGHGGVRLDADLPQPASGWPAAAPGVTLGPVRHAREFGFLLLEARADAWSATAYRTDGHVMQVCAVGPGKVLACDGAAR
ncbi:metallophosphoesterase [Ramlibacter sp. USB13]|uniref:Metallophosphoesterase n=1 Tax=Ramlibacter cellulosilyticus TaxID=2764187 RepID=A0A923SAB9_9BURK|nr:metallophosphoesterase [Ramlibacter cellulosilyticus]MBC5782621.1 metallophosphoesterase [Ramlibacter cellulosilyticus]